MAAGGLGRGWAVQNPLLAHLAHPLSRAHSASATHAGPLTPGQHARPSRHVFFGAGGPGACPPPSHPVSSGDSTFTAAHACASAQLLS